MKTNIAEIEYNTENYTHMINKPCVYRIWFNSYYYVGFTCDISKRLMSHLGFINRFTGGKPTTPRDRKIYRKLITLLNTEPFVSINVEVMLTDKPIETLKQYETSLLHSKYNCPFSVNNVKKIFED